jgi:hypothetical protein
VHGIARCTICQPRPALALVPPLPQPAPAQAFDGSTYEPDQDYDRLNRQQRQVYGVLAHPSRPWLTLAYIAQLIGASEASVSARLRDLRKPKYGGHVVERRRVEGGLYEYRLGDQL